MTLTWTDNSSDETRFEIERARDTAFTVEVVSFTADSGRTSILDLTVAPETSYAYRIRAANQAGASPWSNTATVTTAAVVLVPAAASDLVATPGSGSVALAWKDNSTNETEFSVERSIDGTSFGVVATVPANTTAYKDLGLRHRRTYWYRVQAIDTAGPSAYSNIVSATTR